MHYLARRVVQRAVDSGANLSTVEAASDIIALDAAARRTSEAPRGKALPVFDQPREVCGLRMWTLSIAAVQFLNNCREWFDDRPDVRELALVFALAHARSRVLSEIETAEKAWRSIRVWSLMHWRVPVEAIKTAINELLPSDADADTDRLLAIIKQTAVTPRDHGENDSAYLARLLANVNASAPDQADYGFVITRLMREIGGTADDWIFAPLERISAHVEALNRLDGGKASWAATAMKAWTVESARFLNKYAPSVLKAAANG